MKILIVDDEKKIANALTERFRLRGFDAIPAYDGMSALSRLKSEPFDGMILDLRLPDIDGMEILRQTKAEFPDIKVVIMSGHGNEQDFNTCLELGAAVCFHKPAKIINLIGALSGSNDEDFTIN